MTDRVLEYRPLWKDLLYQPPSNRLALILCLLMVFCLLLIVSRIFKSTAISFHHTNNFDISLKCRLLPGSTSKPPPLPQIVITPATDNPRHLQLSQSSRAASPNHRNTLQVPKSSAAHRSNRKTLARKPFASKIATRKAFPISSDPPRLPPIQTTSTLLASIPEHFFLQSAAEPNNVTEGTN